MSGSGGGWAMIKMAILTSVVFGDLSTGDFFPVDQQPYCRGRHSIDQLIEGLHLQRSAHDDQQIANEEVEVAHVEESRR